MYSRVISLASCQYTVFLVYCCGTLMTVLLCCVVEIADACLFLASDKSKYITGACIEVTGQFTVWFELKTFKSALFYTVFCKKTTRYLIAHNFGKC